MPLQSPKVTKMEVNSTLLNNVSVLGNGLALLIRWKKPWMYKWRSFNSSVDPFVNVLCQFYIVSQVCHIVEKYIKPRQNPK